MDAASIAELASVPLREVLTHSDGVAITKPGPEDLYERWERQQWSAAEIELGRDAEDLRKRIPKAERKQIIRAITTFIIGEYTALDRLGPILAAAPEEADLMYLGTQIADEARHTRVMFRIGEEVLGMDSRPQNMLSQAYALVGPAQHELNELETALVGELQRASHDYVAWLRAVTIFHLIIEGVLGLVGQRALVHSLRDTALLSGIRAAFTAMCRDESRHVGFGMHALREGVRGGHGEAIYDVVESAMPLALRIGAEGSGEIDQMMQRMSLDNLRRQLKYIGTPDATILRLSDGAVQKFRAASNCQQVSAHTR